jgi:hypothetical protein
MINKVKSEDDELLTLEELELELIERLELEEIENFDESLSSEIANSIASHCLNNRTPREKLSDRNLIGVLSPSVSHEINEILLSYCIGPRGLETALRETIYQVAIFNRDQIKLVIFVTDKWDEKIWQHHQKAFGAMGPTGLVYKFSSEPDKASTEFDSRVFKREY